MPPDHEIWKYYQCTSNARVKVQQNLMVLQAIPATEICWLSDSCDLGSGVAHACILRCSGKHSRPAQAGPKPIRKLNHSMATHCCEPPEQIKA